MINPDQQQNPATTREPQEAFEENASQEQASGADEPLPQSPKANVRAKDDSGSDLEFTEDPDKLTYYQKMKMRMYQHGEKPTYPPSAFCIFSEKRRGQLRRTQTTPDPKRIMLRVRREWKTLRSKPVFQREASDLYQQYKELLGEWKQKQEENSPDGLEDIAMRTRSKTHQDSEVADFEKVQARSPLDELIEELKSDEKSAKEDATVSAEVATGIDRGESTPKDEGALEKPSSDVASDHPAWQNDSSLPSLLPKLKILPRRTGSHKAQLHCTGVQMIQPRMALIQMRPLFSRRRPSSTLPLASRLELLSQALRRHQVGVSDQAYFPRDTLPRPPVVIQNQLAHPESVPKPLANPRLTPTRKRDLKAAIKMDLAWTYNLSKAHLALGY